MRGFLVRFFVNLLLLAVVAKMFAGITVEGPTALVFAGMILGLLNERGKMTVSQIAAADPNVSDSTISTTITKLWRDKQMVSKTISPENQRTTIVELTDKGKKAIELINQQRAERFKTLFKAIEVTDEEREVFIRVLNRATAFFDKHLGLNKSTNK